MTSITRATTLCRIPLCSGEQEPRQCTMCGYIAHHMCSNEMLHEKATEVALNIWFCSIDCYEKFAQNNYSDDQNIDSDEEYFDCDDNIHDDNDNETIIDDNNNDNISSIIMLATSIDRSPAQKRRRFYTIATKVKAIKLLMAGISSYQVSRDYNIPRWTLRTWKSKVSQYMSYTGSKKKKCIAKRGRTPILPNPHELVTYMKDIRREEKALCTSHIINYLKIHCKNWLTKYLAEKNARSKSNSLYRLIQRFCHRHGFSRQRLTRRKITQSQLEGIRDAFGAEFHSEYKDNDLDTIYNVDETGIYYDMAPHTIWALRGTDGNVATGTRHSYRMTAVLTIRADGLKLPILFIIRGIPGGTIEKDELETFPKGHVYAVQENAWMDRKVWKAYLYEVFADHVNEPSVLLVDNFDSHVSQESYRIVQEELGSHICSLPPNSTSHCQPLDVSIMGPFKQHLRDLWVQEFDPATTCKEKRLAMILRAIEAWNMISEHEVRRSFEKALPKVS